MTKSLTSLSLINFGDPLEINLDLSVGPCGYVQKQYQIYIRVSAFLTFLKISPTSCCVLTMRRKESTIWRCDLIFFSWRPFFPLATQLNRNVFDGCCLNDALLGATGSVWSAA